MSEPQLERCWGCDSPEVHAHHRLTDAPLCVGCSKRYPQSSLVLVQLGMISVNQRTTVPEMLQLLREKHPVSGSSRGERVVELARSRLDRARRQRQNNREEC